MGEYIIIYAYRHALGNAPARADEKVYLGTGIPFAS
jgi:hypothetical protein